MKKLVSTNLLTLLLSVFLLFFVSGTASALTVTSLYGDIDGFGINFPVNGSFSNSYPALSKNDLADVGTITDEWMWDDKTWTQTYDVSSFSSIADVSLEVVTLGQGWHGISTIFFDGVLMGSLTDGDNSGAFLDTNWSRKDVFALSGLFDGVSSITIATVGTDDQWALDYSKLSVTGTPVPEPATMLLLGSALLGLAGLRRKFKK